MTTKTQDLRYRCNGGPNLGGGGMLIGLGVAGRGDVLPYTFNTTLKFDYITQDSTTRVYTKTGLFEFITWLGGKITLIERHGPKTTSPPTERVPPATQNAEVRTVVLGAISTTRGDRHRKQSGSSYQRFDSPNTCDHM